MPYFEIDKDNPRFPPPYFADPDGMLASGGKMDAGLLLQAYGQGIYYWHHPMKHIKWWSPDPRVVLLPGTGSLSAPQDSLTTTVNKDPAALLRLCQQVYNVESAMGPAWLSERMFRIFMELQEEGRGVSVEVWQGDRLAGGFFGICLGGVCHGEYAVALEPGADSLAIATAAEYLAGTGIGLMDMQKETARDSQLPYEELSRVEFVSRCSPDSVTFGAPT